MIFATIVNLLTIVLCTAVLVQCWRMTRALRAFRDAEVPATVAALEAATSHAEAVLGTIRTVLAIEAQPKLALIADAAHVADELGVMVGIANATADRLLDASRASRSNDARELAA